jgi:hypothetical protein
LTSFEKVEQQCVQSICVLQAEKKPERARKGAEGIPL